MTASPETAIPEIDTPGADIVRREMAILTSECAQLEADFNNAIDQLTRLRSVQRKTQELLRRLRHREVDLEGTAATAHRILKARRRMLFDLGQGA